MSVRNLMLTMVLACSMALAACSGDYGKTVEQGRAVAFGDGKVTFVKDTNVDPKKAPTFVNSIRTFSLPMDPMEIGPEPKVGCLIDLNLDKKEVQVYQNMALATHPITIVNEQKGIEYFNPLVKGKTFPMVNKDSGEVTVYMKKALITFKIPASCPSDEMFWSVGDMVRVFTKEEGKARRFMNITKTNIFKK